MSKSKPAAWKGVFNITRMSTFVVIEVFAALALDGWLSIAVWVVAGWTAMALVLVTFGIASLAAKQAAYEDSEVRS